MKRIDRKPHETDEQFVSKMNRVITDKIIEDIELITENMNLERIMRIFKQLNIEALEVIIQECNTLEKFEVSKIAQDLIKEKVNNEADK